MLTCILIVEVDEDAHASYDNICENKRVCQLFSDLGDRPLIIIRFNPDSYQTEGTKMLSAFKYDKLTGVPTIRDKEEWKWRCDILLNKMREVIDKSVKEGAPDKEIDVIRLFFDGYKGE